MATLSKPVVWIIVLIFLPVGLLFAILMPMSNTTAQIIVRMSTGWFMVVWTVTLLVRVLRRNNPACENASSPETVQEDKAHG